VLENIDPTFAFKGVGSKHDDLVNMYREQLHNTTFR